jgi:AsmA protein
MMKKAVKWIAIVLGGLIVLVIVALLVIPSFVDLQKYKPRIEEQVAKSTGRPFHIGGDLELSLFPWAGVAFSDLHLGNPSGFKEKDFVTIRSFDVRVKLLPLIFKDIQVKRFVVEGPRIVLEKSKEGRGNWEALGKPSETVAQEKPEAPGKKDGGELPIKGLAVGEFAVTEGSALWIDHGTGERREISDMTLRLSDVSLQTPIRLTLAAQMDGKPLSAEGAVGPLGKEPGKGTMPVDLSFSVLDELKVALKGQVRDAATTQNFDFSLEISPFSPRKLMTALDQEFPISTTDPNALDRLALKMMLKGNPKDVMVSDGTLDLDQSKITFNARAKDFSKPDLQFKINLDEIDLDRYLPPPGEEKAADVQEETPTTQEKKKIDYRPLRKPVLDGEIRIGKLKIKGARLQDVRVQVRAKNGLYHLDPFAFKAYEGDLTSKTTFDVRQDTPKTRLDLDGKGFMIQPLLKDVVGKDFLQGTTQAKIALGLEGDDPERIKRTLNGQGQVLFEDGAIVGIDIPGMVRNVTASFGHGEKSTERPRTDFTELEVPFTITNGLVETTKTSLASPLLRLLASGNANLVSEALDFRMEPSFVATLKGQGDAKERSGITVPVIVSGTFSSPKFQPDMKAILEKKLKQRLPESSGLKDMLKGKESKEGEATSPEEAVKGLIKSLPFGKQ